ncbi:MULTISPECIES: hypothetical protein [unclassified Streptomyces]|uniref:hypothetical protein n=1 Tax=unclassified Streptomyces TaxID=2593676 RepID=UPI002025611A|nr:MULTISPECIES: hypothetical protein [unclassified Streptomyces]MCX4550562.1 hypothetical protein [Streptomyces sp. NBC_01500]WSC22009.1 hypothetical protein OIE60_21275 [Streptomyces sp. NBC_01766]
MTESYAQKLASSSQLAAAAFVIGTLAEPSERNAEIVKLMDRADVIAVHIVNDFDPHLADPVGSETLCEEAVHRALNDEQTGRISGLCARCETAGQERAISREKYGTGDRVLLPDGSARAVTGTMRSADGDLWLYVGDGVAHRADRCERVDTSRVGEARATACRAAGVLRAGSDTGEAADELGNALRYLAQADPDTLAELSATGTRLTVEVHRLTVAPGDILHQYGVRLNVLDTGISTSGEPQWWASVQGVTQADRRVTYRAPWTTGIGVEYAAWDLVTVERIAPTPLSS